VILSKNNLNYICTDNGAGTVVINVNSGVWFQTGDIYMVYIQPATTSTGDRTLVLDPSISDPLGNTHTTLKNNEASVLIIQATSTTTAIVMANNFYF
jgi:predicted RNA-binding protein (virulence factor B family)